MAVGLLFGFVLGGGGGVEKHFAVAHCTQARGSLSENCFSGREEGEGGLQVLSGLRGRNLQSHLVV